MWTALVTLLGPPLAFGHGEPTPLPPAAEYDIRWFQPEANPRVDDWDIEITPFDPDEDGGVVQALPDPDLESCWVMTVPVDSPARVRIRAVQGGQYSSWSRYTTVPEPTLRVAVGLGAVLLAGLARRRRRIDRKKKLCSDCDR